MDYLGGAVDKNPRANARGPGFDPWFRKTPHAVEQLSLCATTTTTTATTEAHAPKARAPQQEKPLEWEAHARQPRVASAHRNQRKAAQNNENTVQPKRNKQINLKKI